ncbi:Uncharacterized protein FKW44_001453 [Caligus rogercresseyi]|uniref:Reverse transcriptase domain-containing protein n=1 Tax=Caligus rogercresseyi TaxID=217165 RepID=A0A7T8KIV3_CALRO|nr:Uncharacterized protein FKW44_001453 [Caligus rogercresseyi]
MGKGKSTTNPASYRPICILPALSKVLETIVKSDLEDYLAKTETLPNSQFGFRKGRSTTAALASRGERLSVSSNLTSLLPSTPSTSCSFYQSWGSLDCWQTV